MIERSRSAYLVCASVRGIGVAVMCSVCGARLFARNFARCATPKRCCSSMIARPRSRNSTRSTMSACVPTTRSHSPLARRPSVAARSRAPMLPKSASTRTPKGKSSGASFCACCEARISVGAISALWRPFDAASTIAAAATIVLPLPTSPCKRRFIGAGRAMSSHNVAIARRCAAVNAKGNDAARRSSKPGAATSSGAPPPELRSARRNAAASAIPKNSSKIRRSRAAAAASRVAGRCASRHASTSGAYPWRSTSSRGMTSRTSAASVSKFRSTSEASARDGTSLPAG